MERFLPLVLFLSIIQINAAPAQATPGGFFAMDTIQEIGIVFEQENWRYLLDSLRYNGEDLLLGEVEINGKRFKDVGVRYRDGRSFQPGQQRNGLLIDLDFINTFQNYQGHQTINLSSALRDPSLVREVLGYEIARDYLPAPRANYARVTVNGEYYGLFVNVEPIEDAFLKVNFDHTDGSFFFSQPATQEPLPEGCKSGVDGSLQYDNKARCYLRNFRMLSESGWDDLIELTRVLNEETGEIEKMLDVDDALWMLAFNNFIVNLSSYTGQHSPNYYLYQDHHEHFHPIIWDLNLAFGSFKNTGLGSDLRLRGLEEMDPLLHIDNPAKPLISKLMANDLYRKIYLAHLRTMQRDWMANGRLEQRARALQALIRPAFLEDQNRYYSVTNFDDALRQMIGDRSQIPGIVNFMKRRYEFLKKHEVMTLVPPKIDSVEVAQRKKFSSDRVNDFKISAKVEKFAKFVHLYYRFAEADMFRPVRMYDDGQHNDGEANDGIYGASVSPRAADSTLQYYIFAENAGAVSYFPEHYKGEHLTANLEDLNR